MRPLSFFVINLLFLFTTTLQAQQLNYTTVEQKTQLYAAQGNWDKLISLGDSAIQQDIDYYGLRYRMGMAYFEQQRYWKSQYQFEKALDFSPKDYYSSSYLALNYLYTERYADAKRVGAVLNDTIYHPKTKAFEFLSIDVGSKFSSQSDSVNHLGFAGIGLSQKLGYKWSMQHYASVVFQNYLNLPYQQYEYSNRLSWAFARGWQGGLGVHYSFLYSYQSRTGPIPPPAIGTTTDENTNTQHILVTNLNLKKQWRRWCWGINGNMISYYEKNRYQSTPSIPLPGGDGPPDSTVITRNRIFQAGLALGYHQPLGNESFLAFRAEANIHTSNTSDFLPMWKARLSYSPYWKLRFDLEYFQTDATLFTEHDALVLNNAFSKTKNRASFRLGYQISPKVGVYGTYQWENREETTFNFQYHSFFTGINFSL